MAKNYRYTLGVDVGIASLGTAVILIDEAGNTIKPLDSGVRIFSVAGGAADRRQKRLERKHIRKKKQRLASLEKLLVTHGLLPKDSNTLHALMLKNPYELRAEGVAKPYASLYDLGRGLLHMARFRGAGFLTQLEEDPEAADEGSQEKKGDKQKTANSYRLLETRLAESGETLSQYFVARLQGKEAVRRRKHLVASQEVDYAVPRFLVKEEFWKIWTTQSAGFTHLTPAIGEEIYNAIFAERPHAPYATGSCSLIPDEKRLPCMHRLSEERRIYEQLNNIRYDTAEGSSCLPREVRDVLVALAFGQGKNLNKTEIKKHIKAHAGETVLQVNLGDEDKGIKGFCQVQAFMEIPAWKDMPEQQRDAIIDFIADPAVNPAEPFSELLPEEQFLQELCSRLRLCGPDAVRTASAALAKLAKDRSNLGMTATSRILEKLKEGYHLSKQGSFGLEDSVWQPHTHRSAADACNFMAEEERMRAMRGKHEQLPYYGEILRHDVMPVHPWHKKRAVAEEAQWGRIPNPVVHVALNQLRKVVNEIVARYGKPQSIHVEFSRELGLSEVKRTERANEKKKRERDNERISTKLAELGLPQTRRNRLKYRLWEEQGGKSLYSFKHIEASDIAGCELDHLIPQSQGGTDTPMNLVLVLANENLAKGAAFPYDFIRGYAPDQWKEITKHIGAKTFPKAKARRFSSDAQSHFEQHGDAEQTDHRMTDTSYIAKMGARYLSALCADIVAVKGGVTSQLRHLWGLDGLEYELFGLPISEHLYNTTTGKVVSDTRGYPARNPLWVAKPRIDHRHHALDAIVAACTERSMVTRIVRAEKQRERLVDFPVPFGTNAADFRRQILHHVQTILVSPKKEHGLEGRLHAETKYRILQKDTRKKDVSNSYFTRYRRSLDAIKNKAAVTGIMFKGTIPLDIPEIQAASAQCTHIIQSIEQRYAAAEASIVQANATAIEEGLKGRNLWGSKLEEAVVAEAIKQAQEDGQIGATYPYITPKCLVAINKPLQFGFESQSNYSMDFYVTKADKIGWECITRIDANTPTFIPQWRAQKGVFLWRLCIDDIIEVTISEELKKKFKAPCNIGKNYFIVQKMSADRLQCNLLNDARALDGRNMAVKAGTTVYEEYKRWTTGEMVLDRLCELGARKVEFSAFGKICRKHKRLWHGKKKP